MADIKDQFFKARFDQILDAAIKVFAEKGFHATTIKDIAKAANIADGTIYNYFENKLSLMLAILDRMNESERRNEDFAQFSEGDFRDFLRNYFRHRLNVLKSDNFETLRVVISEILVNKELRELHQQKILAPTFSLAKEYFDKWAKRKIIKPMNTELMIKAISGMVLGVILDYIINDKNVDSTWNELPDFLTEIILKGIEQ